MLQILIPALLITGGVVALVKTADNSKDPTKPPQFKAEDKAGFIDTSERDGVKIQTFNPAMASIILRLLARRGLDEQEVEKSALGRMTFKLTPPAGDVSATQGAIQAQQNGMVVFGSISLALEKTEAAQYLIFALPEDRTKIAGVDSNFAILLDLADAAGAARGTASPATSPAPSVTFDPEMPLEVAREVETALADPSPNVAGLRRMADTLAEEKLELGAKALRARASAVELQRKLAAQRTAGVTTADAQIAAATAEIREVNAQLERETLPGKALLAFPSAGDNHWFTGGWAGIELSPGRDASPSSRSDGSQASTPAPSDPSAPSTSDASPAAAGDGQPVRAELVDPSSPAADLSNVLPMLRTSPAPAKNEDLVDDAKTPGSRTLQRRTAL